MLLHETAHAKINLFLHITGKREDGYHLLDSLAIFAGACDRLLLKKTENQQNTENLLHISGRFSDKLSASSDNLVLKAASLLKEKLLQKGTQETLLPFESELIKELPIASGIGGGSADAAAMLRLLQKYWHAPYALLQEIAPLLGADIPVCLEEKTTRMQGVGEILESVPPLPNFGILLVNPGVAVSTPAIFKRGAFPATQQEENKISFPENGWKRLEDFIAFLERTRNDLEKPAIEEQPLIQEVLTQLDTLPNRLLSRMSGSGATCFALFKDAETAQKAAHHLTALPQAAKWWHWAGAPLL